MLAEYNEAVEERDALAALYSSATLRIKSDQTHFFLNYETYSRPAARQDYSRGSFCE